MGRLSEIITNLQSIVKNTDLAVNDVVIFEQAIKIYISNKIGESKRENIKSINSLQSKPSNDVIKPKPISDKQAAYLMELGYSGNLNITSKEASVLISELKSKGRIKNGQN